jgi:ABC-type transport system involved in cytochrome bd biosynthesis fused ATPase/permease subunit
MIMMMNDEKLEKILFRLIAPVVGIGTIIMMALLGLALYLIFNALVEFNPTIWDMLGSKSIK